MSEFTSLSSIDRLAEVIDFCWEQTKVSGFAGYPTKMRERSGLEEMVRKVWNRPGDEILLWEVGEIQSVVLLAVEVEEKYLQTLGGIYGNDLARGLDELLWYRDRVYPGFELLIGYPDRPQIRETLSQRGELIESSVFFRQHLAEMKAADRYQVLGPEDFQELAHIHDETFPDIYWNSQRILEHFSDWIIVGDEASYSFSMVYPDQLVEMFGLRQPRIELIQASLQVYFKRGYREMIASADQDDPLVEMFLATGFTQTGDYVAYRF